MTRKVLITGASSDIGIAVCRLYLDNKCSVTGFYNKGQPGLTKLDEEYPELTLHQLDFESPKNTESFIEKRGGRERPKDRKTDKRENTSYIAARHS